MAMAMPKAMAMGIAMGIAGQHKTWQAARAITWPGGIKGRL